MGGIIGLILVVIGLVLLYDVLAGKATSIVGLFNGTVDTVSSWQSRSGNSGSSGSSTGGGGTGGLHPL